MLTYLACSISWARDYIAVLRLRPRQTWSHGTEGWKDACEDTKWMIVQYAYFPRVWILEIKKSVSDILIRIPFVSSSIFVSCCKLTYSDGYPTGKPDSDISARPVTSLGHQGGVYWDGHTFFKLCPIILNYAQHIFQGDWKILQGAKPPWLRVWSLLSVASWVWLRGRLHNHSISCQREILLNMWCVELIVTKNLSEQVQFYTFLTQTTYIFVENRTLPVINATWNFKLR